MTQNHAAESAYYAVQALSFLQRTALIGRHTGSFFKEWPDTIRWNLANSCAPIRSTVGGAAHGFKLSLHIFYRCLRRLRSARYKHFVGLLFSCLAIRFRH